MNLPCNSRPGTAFPKMRNKDDNSDILRYMGYGELWARISGKSSGFAVMLRNNLRRENGRRAAGVEHSSACTGTTLLPVVSEET